ncbi:MAG: hypothetical protein HY438_04080 [DPANN group archaeon]|nr:hypothetical protein [DPANN group archaeon]
MSFAGIVKKLVEYGPPFIPGVLGLHIYYTAKTLVSQQLSTMSPSTRLEVQTITYAFPAAIEFARLGMIYASALTYKLPSPHNIVFVGTNVIAYVGITISVTLLNNNARNKKRGGKEEEKQTLRLEKIIAQHASQQSTPR